MYPKPTSPASIKSDSMGWISPTGKIFKCPQGIGEHGFWVLNQLEKNHTLGLSDSTVKIILKNTSPASISIIMISEGWIRWAGGNTSRSWGDKGNDALNIECKSNSESKLKAILKKVSYPFEQLYVSYLDKPSVVIDISFESFIKHGSKAIKIAFKRQLNNVTVYANPSIGEAVDFCKKSAWKELCWLVDGKIIYFWDASIATYEMVGNELKADSSPHFCGRLFLNSKLREYVVRSEKKKLPSHLFLRKWRDISDNNSGSYLVDERKIASCNRMAVRHDRLEYRDIDLYVNPTIQEAISICNRSNQKELRWLVSSSDIYFWDAFAATHTTIGSELGVNSDREFCGYLYYDEGTYIMHSETMNCPRHKFLTNWKSSSKKRGKMYVLVEPAIKRIAKREVYDGVPIYVNPTSQQMIALGDRVKDLRWIVWNNDLYVWDANKWTHNEFIGYTGARLSETNTGYFLVEKGGVYILKAQGDGIPSHRTFAHLISIGDKVKGKRSEYTVHKKRIAASPVTTKMYGGLPDNGDYEYHTEYEVGAQRIAEAAHCILGSLGNIRTPSDKRYEKGHVVEELDIIRKSISVYSNDLYVEELEKGGKYADMSARSIRSNSPKLRNLAMSLQLQAKKDDDLDSDIRRVAVACYDVVIALAEAMYISVKKYPESVLNAFRHADLRASVNVLQNSIRTLFSKKSASKTHHAFSIAKHLSDRSVKPKRKKNKRIEHRVKKRERITVDRESEPDPMNTGNPTTTVLSRKKRVIEAILRKGTR